MKPALTPEEWDDGELMWPTVALETTRGGRVLVSDDLQCVTVDDKDRHALAALALHGQPFGFTREDVAMLLEVAMDYTAATPLIELAARIESLLPPEAK